MISVEKAYKIVLDNSIFLDTEEITIDNATNRVLAKDVVAGRDYPPFDRVAMDGIAIDYQSYSEGERTFEIENIQAAGEPQKILKSKSNCIEVMTGAMLPQGCTTVIPYEQVVKIKNSFEITDGVSNLKNIHGQASDVRRGETILKAPFQISAGSTSILATEGVQNIKVLKLPRVALVSTGNELVDISSMPEKHQIRRSNSKMISIALKKWGIRATEIHIDDNKIELQEKVAGLLKKHDVVLFSGAVSKGKFDYLPEILESLGVEKLFHKVAQRPGKPFWFGKNVNTKVFAFPGNPISTWVCFQRYFIPWLKKSLHLPDENKTAHLKTKQTFDKPLALFQLVKETNTFGELEPVKNNGSGDLSSLAYATGMVELPADDSKFENNKKYNFYPF